ncbi:MAG: hypothetical protein HW421_2114 [Ignavibacteria bacterium]|nr:hypothetical protein [Ignavibacteria bacterium]
MNAQCGNTYPYPQFGKVGINKTVPTKAFHVHGYPENCKDPAIRISYGNDDNTQFYYSHLAIKSPDNELYSSFATEKDFILQNAFNAEDLIITTRSDSGRIRFGTTPVQNPSGTLADIERMTILPMGHIGMWTQYPMEVLQIGQKMTFHICGQHAGTDFLGFNKFVRDVGVPPNAVAHYYRIQQGAAGSLEFSNDYINHDYFIDLALNGYGATANDEISYSESTGGWSGMRIKLDANNFAHFGIGSVPGSGRLLVRGFGNSSSAYSLSVINSSQNQLFLVRDDGNVGIGVSNPAQKLVVDGTICAKEVRVSLSGSPCWSDFVFDKDYKLMPLDELEKHIKQNKHLPGIPSSAEVESEGVVLGEMQAKLLTKIEELTLYLIELKKENEKMKSEINKLKGGQ